VRDSLSAAARTVASQPVTGAGLCAHLRDRSCVTPRKVPVAPCGCRRALSSWARRGISPWRWRGGSCMR